MMKNFIIGAVGLATIGGLVFTLPTKVEHKNTVTPDQHNKEWFAKASQSIAESEYHIRFQDDVGAFQSVNRSNNYRVTYRGDGFSIKPRTGNQEWVFDLSLKSIHKGEKTLAIADAAEMITEKERMSVIHRQFDIEYVNTLEGMRQNFIIRDKPKGDLPLTIELNENSELIAVESSSDDIVLLDKDQRPALWYKDLKVWDANGTELTAYVNVDQETIKLIVHDEAAVYPITVDPISQTPDWSFESNQINAQLGYAVSGIGDVNGDNFEDFAVGAPYYDNGQSDEGAVFIFHGDISSSLPTTYKTMLESNQVGAMFGYSLSGAGRLNGDQFHDIVVGAPGYDNGQTDEGAVFVYLGSGIGLSTTAAAQRESNQDNAQMGYSVASAGNINLDTFNDILVGTPLWDNGQIDEGMVQVFFGGNTGLLADAPITYESNNDGAQMGYTVSGGADINRDNRQDIIVGLPFYTNGSNKEGAVMMFLGQSTGGLAASPSWTYESNVAGYQVGHSVDIVGDVNGDGYADVVVGSPFAQSTLPNEGIALAFYGNSSGLPTTPSWQVTGGQLNARFGYCVTGVGDVNNDGNDDVAISAPLWDGGLEDEGRVHLYFGSTGGISTSVAWLAEGDQANAQYGNSVSGFGDINRDGYDDFGVGIPFFDGGQLDEGAVQVYLGAGPAVSTASATRDGREVGAGFGSSVSSAGDVNGDGYSDIIVGSPFSDKTTDTTDAGKVTVYYGGPGGASVSASWVFLFSQRNANFGASVACAGDVNNDGYSDIVVGAPGFDGDVTDEGKAWLFLGSSTGLRVTPSWSAEGNNAGARFGSAVACAGDVNGDGNSDVLIGAPNYSEGQTFEGAAFLFRGNSTGLAATPIWSAQSNAAGANFGAAIANSLDINGDGFSDIAIGAPNQNTDADAATEGRLYVYYGSAQFATSAPSFIDSTSQDGANFAAALNSAGDVNGDGYSELIVSAPRFDNGSTDEGRVIVYYGSASGLSRNNIWSTEGNRDNTRIGNAVAGGGDFNGDGFADILIGAANMTSGQTNEGTAMVYYGSSQGLQPSFGLMVESDQSFARLGTSIANAGDINGDGLSDMIVGAPNHTNTNAGEGRLFIYHGRLNGLSNVPNRSLDGTKAGDQFGFSLVAVGDVNGDGFGDFMAGSPYMDNRFLDDGRAFLYLGSANGVAATPSQRLNPTQQELSYFGFSIASLGDVNNDGYSDVAVSAPYFDNPITGVKDIGRVYVYHGSATGLNEAPATVIDGQQERSLFGFSIAGVDDVNGDGFNDILIGEPSWDKDNIVRDAGRIGIYYGSSSGIVVENPWIFPGDQADGQLGWSVASAGDVNRDGLGDFIIGAPFYDNPQVNEGKAWIFTGQLFGVSNTPIWTAESNQANAKYGHSVASAGDIDGNGYTEVLVGAIWFDNPSSNEGRVYLYSSGANGVSTQPTWTAESNRETTEFGASISSIGDINGDGYGDIAIGATSYFNGQPSEGAVYVYAGSQNGLANEPQWFLEGNKSFAQFGNAVSGGSDLDGDGYSDLLIAAFRESGAGQNSGAVHIFYGNGTPGLALRPRQLRQDLVTPIVEGGRTQNNTTVGFAVNSRSYFGRTTVKAEFEVKPINTAFNGGNTVLSDTWVPTTGTNTLISKVVNGLTPGTNYKWRGRLRYRLNTGAVQMYGHWFGNVYPKTLGETSFRTGVVCNLVARAGSDAQICSGSPITLGETTIGGVAPLQYRWSPGKGLSDSTIMMPIARPNANTRYIVTITDANNCISFDTINVSVVPGVSVKTVNDVSICVGDTVFLDATPANGTPPYRYNWSPAFTISNDKIQKPIVVPPVTTQYVVKITDINNCVSFDTVLVSVKPQPAKPTITQQGNTLICSEAAQYQWFKDGQIIQGANQRSYTFTNTTGSGVYRVRVTNPEGCSATSETRIIETSVEEEVIATGNPVLYPNPASSNTKLMVPTIAGMTINISIINALGATLYTTSEIAASSMHSVNIPTNGIAVGVYVVKITSNGKEWTLSFVKN
ncbi:MAG: FG-GAP-like repeat-containing protein [Candidatus Kapaibacterium sp.]|jgi:hypothetical protein